MHTLKPPKLTICLALLLAGAGPATAQQPALQDPALAALVDKLPAADAATANEVYADLLRLGPMAVVKLVAALQEPDTVQGPKISDARTAAQAGDTRIEYALHGLSSYVRRADKESDAERRVLAQTLAEQLGGNYTPGVKAFLLQQLRLCGAAEVVPDLAKMLLVTDQDPNGQYLYHDAAEALLSIQRHSSAPVAGTVFLEFLPKSQGRVRLEIIQALGTLHDRAAVKALLPLAGDADADTRLAALYALANIGDLTTVDTVLEAASAPERFTAARTVEAALLLARRLREQSLGTASTFRIAALEDAVQKIYRGLQKTHPQDHQVLAAVLWGLAEQGGVVVDRDLLTAMDSGAADLRAVAIAAAASMKQGAVTGRWVNHLDGANPRTRAAILAMLAKHGDAAAVPAVVAALRDTDDTVRSAAIEAAGAFDTSAAAQGLIGLLGSPRDGDRRAAETALRQMPGHAADRAIVAALPGAPAEVRRPLLMLLGARGAVDQVNTLLEYTEDKDAGVRAAAWTALGGLADVQALPLLINGVLKTPEEGRDTAITALMAATRGGDPDQRARPMIAALNGADARTRVALLTLLGRGGGAAALTAVRAALQDADPVAQDAAIRALIGWPDATPAPDLLTLARTSKDEKYQVLALRGYLRMTGIAIGDPDERLHMYKEALGVAQRPDDKKQVLAALADANTGVATAEAVQLVAPLLDEAAVQPEAAQAAVLIGSHAVAGTDEAGLAQIKAAMQKVLTVAKDDTVRRLAAETLARDLGPTTARKWLVLGPYPNDGVGFDKIYEPETTIDLNRRYSLSPTVAARWKPADTNAQGYLDLRATFMPNENVVAYATLWVKSPTARQAILSVGSDDGCKVWWNGKVVDSVNTPRGAVPGQDQVPVDVQAGWNQVLFKVIQGTSEWGLYFDLLDDAKKPLTNLSYSIRKPK